MAIEVSSQPPVNAFVEKNSHETDSISRFFASSKKATT
jgi:hypothetical protein